MDPPKDKHESLGLAWHVNCDFHNVVKLNGGTGSSHTIKRPRFNILGLEDVGDGC